MPPMKIYETLQQSNADNLGAGAGPQTDAHNFFSGDDTASKKDGASLLATSAQERGSPQKSLAIKGPPKIISDKLELRDYQGVEVTDINVRPVQQSVA